MPAAAADFAGLLAPLLPPPPALPLLLAAASPAGWAAAVRCLVTGRRAVDVCCTPADVATVEAARCWACAALGRSAGIAAAGMLALCSWLPALRLPCATAAARAAASHAVPCATARGIASADATGGLEAGNWAALEGALGCAAAAAMAAMKAGGAAAEPPPAAWILPPAGPGAVASAATPLPAAAAAAGVWRRGSAGTIFPAARAAAMAASRWAARRSAASCCFCSCSGVTSEVCDQAKRTAVPHLLLVDLHASCSTSSANRSLLVCAVTLRASACSVAAACCCLRAAIAASWASMGFVMPARRAAAATLAAMLAPPSGSAFASVAFEC